MSHSLVAAWPFPIPGWCNFIVICQNCGATKNRRERSFPPLTDDEVRSLESIVRDSFGGFDNTETQG